MNQNYNTHLILITNSYPFGAVAESFLDLELPYLSQSFDSVVIVPRSLPAQAERIERKLPANVSVNSDLLQKISCKKSLRIFNYIFTMILSRYTYKELHKRPRILVEISSLKKAIGYLYETLRVKEWALHYIEQNNVDLMRTVFYTYWLDSATMGIGLAKKKYSEVKLISRAHGYDLYEERHSPHYIPFRLETLQGLNHLYLISEHGKEYITKRYPFLKGICSLSRLGVEEQEAPSKASSDGIFRIISCSHIVPVKRIHLIIFALRELGLSRSYQKIEWVHIGYGPLLEEMKNLAITFLPKNVKYKFLGLLTNSDVLSFYRHNPIDVFINVSSSEGIPVSIMETQSCGIPAIATAVGGTPEIVSEKVGALISENPSPKEIAHVLGFFIDHPDVMQQMRLNSIANWSSLYNAKKNFKEFALSLKGV